MADINLVKDASFLKRLNNEKLKNHYVKIVVLNSKEIPIKEITGRVISGSITVNGDSAVRRAGSLSLIAEPAENDLTDIDNLLSINKRVQILVGIENNIDSRYDKIIWLKQGIFVITQPSITHNTTNITISLQLKDKMCLLNGEMGGNLPTSVTFDSYDQIIGSMEVDTLPDTPLTTYVYKLSGKEEYYMWEVTKGWTEASSSIINTKVEVKQRIFDIIQTAVCNYGDEDIARIIINDVPLELKQSVRYIGSDNLYYNTATGVYTLDSSIATSGEWQVFEYNQDCGYVYTDFVYPGSLVTSIGDNVCSVLDKIKSQLGNYEYYYDIDGNFIFQEKKNYLNTSYDPVQYYDGYGDWHDLSIDKNLLNEGNYFVDFSNTGESAYDFDDTNELIISYNNSPKYTNIKNDYHIWGENENKNVIHYHVAIKEKPTIFNQYKVIYEKDEFGEYTGKVGLTPNTEGNKEYHFIEEVLFFGKNEADLSPDQLTLMLNSSLVAVFNNETSTLELKNITQDTALYTPDDWRAELYLQGLSKKAMQIRPDVYEQELLDLWDDIYDMKNKCFKADVVNRPNDLKYWFDYIEPYGKLHDISVDSIGTKIYSYSQTGVKKLYNTDIPDRIMINTSDTMLQKASIIEKCEKEGQLFSNVSDIIYNQVAVGTAGYVAQETARNLIYQYTDYNETISLSLVPIYYLEPNTRITINDRAANIKGDYVIKSINVPLDGRNAMSITASKALVRL